MLKRVLIVSCLTGLVFFASLAGQTKSALADIRPAFAGRVALVNEKALSEPLLLPAAGGSPLGEPVTAKENSTFDPLDDYGDSSAPGADIADPLEPWNRFWFSFNDILYRGVLNPISKGYEAITPTEFQQGFRNFFRNLLFPVRFVNCLLQGEFMSAGVEASRFIINTTAGFGGFMAPGERAKPLWSPEPDVVDTAQTLGRWGMKDGFYIIWPVLGPNTLRSSLGLLGDAAMNPLTYVNPGWISWAVAGGRGLVNFSGVMENYEGIKRIAVEPYLAIRSAYVQSSRARVGHASPSADQDNQWVGGY